MLPCCRRCTLAPPRCDTAKFSLVGDPGRKNGEKRLKQLLLRTAEWANPALRADLALQCDRDGFVSLAKVLRREATSAALRKDDFLYVARAWGCVALPTSPPVAHVPRVHRAPGSHALPDTAAKYGSRAR